MDKNKVFMFLNGKPVITYSVDTIKKSGINDIIIVVSREDMDFCANEILKGYNVSYVEGGSERQISVYNGLMAIRDRGYDMVLIHDGARPLVTEETIKKALKAASDYGAAAVGVKVKDTIKVVEDGFISYTPPRETLWAVQTPQVFKYDLILKAHEKAIEDNFLATDDTVLVERMGVKVRIVEGCYSNIKITTPEDLHIAEILAVRK